MSLRSLSDQSLLSRIQQLTRRERSITLLVLMHLNEVERRQLHLKLGYSSMFDYCTACLGYSASAASRRIRTARCVARYPEIHALLKSNEVNISTVAQVSSILTVENRAAVLSRIRGKSQREVETVVAEFEPLARMPRDRARTVMVRVPAPRSLVDVSAPGPRADSACAGEISTHVPLAPADLSRIDSHDRSGCTSVASHDRSGCTSVAPSVAPACADEASRSTVTLQRRTVLQFSASDAFMAKLETVRSLAWHRPPANASLEQVFELALDLMIEKEHPSRRRERRERTAARRKERRAKAAAHQEQRDRASEPSQTSGNATVTNVRYIAPAIRDRVHVRDQGQCKFKGPDGRRCESRRALQIDHVRPVKTGGDGTEVNLRVLCAYHNRLEAERILGWRYKRAGPTPR